MKMGPGVFWGIVLVVIGLSIILKVLFDISFFKILFGIGFILIGVRILIQKPILNIQNDSDSNVFFSEKYFSKNALNTDEFNTFFSKTVFDFRETDMSQFNYDKIEFNTIFGNTDIFLPKNVKLQIKADAVFASVQMPNGNSAAFGTTQYESDSDTSHIREIKIEAHAIFGNIEFFY